PRPLHAPTQPTNCQPRAGFARSRTVPPEANGAAQRPGHAMPRGELLTVPRPLTETASETMSGAKVAVTVFGPSIARAQSALLLHAPPQCRKRKPAAGVACSATRAPCSQAIEQTPGQEIPGRSLATEPWPRPRNTTPSSYCGAPTCESQGDSWTSNQAPECP